MAPSTDTVEKGGLLEPDFSSPHFWCLTWGIIPVTQLFA